jgi:hypothetical protein
MNARWLLLLAALGACSLERRSDSFACENQSDCGDGRTCDQGWCVETGGPTIDADPNAPDADPNAPDADPNAPDGAPADAFQCPLACSSCNEDNVCIMACAADDSCAEQVVCPPGVSCKVECEGDNSCAAGVDCTDATSCRIECNGAGACAERLLCGAGQCIVECPGDGSCAAGTDCSDSCSCQTTCAPTACDAPSECVSPDNPCTDNDDDCGGLANGNCNTC